MVAETRLFGTVDIAEDKILEFPMGLIGFENLKKFAIIYDSDREVCSKISWLQSMEEPALALPIIHPSELIDDYGPIVEDELMKNIGDPADADILMFVTLSIPSDLTKMTANLKAPIIINTEGRKAIQVIVENEDYKVKFNAYEAIQKMKEKAGEYNIEITVLEAKGDQVKIGISAPKSVPVYRKEIYAQIQEENREAVANLDVESLKKLL